MNRVIQQPTFPLDGAEVPREYCFDIVDYLDVHQ